MCSRKWTAEHLKKDIRVDYFLSLAVRVTTPARLSSTLLDLNLKIKNRAREFGAIHNLAPVLNLSEFILRKRIAIFESVLNFKQI